MPKGDNFKGKGGVKFSKDRQPKPENRKRANRELKTMKEALLYLGAQLYSKETTETGEDLLISWEGQIAKGLIQKAMKTDLKAVELLGKYLGWEPKNKEGEGSSIKIEGQKIIVKQTWNDKI